MNFNALPFEDRNKGLPISSLLHHSHAPILFLAVCAIFCRTSYSKVQGIPTLVFVDGETGAVITKDG